ncbi:ankyrin repeat-containing domain protein [Microdochium trichocladiopsis]|uniref:Ankyrin repeat-containing domain protein n=1 Tax=Microdochium trichocladiopsis TaxID=1682393 RepID=A0A9P8YG90_9PEZI|nr:ankyrin repeat-containing domain protein [Microdochium trichocladiopsis]KAH7038362.1 ankyrin repeat-containing domain protein [Microdochium trichocladiopsis]
MRRLSLAQDAIAPSPLPSRKRPRLSPQETPLPTKLTHRDYEIGWICAIHPEFAAAQALLEIHDTLPSSPNDNNHYVLGRSGHFNVVLACLPAGGMGMNQAAAVSSKMQMTYASLRLLLMVGVAGGTPTEDNDVRLGDVVVGLSVVQHDIGKTIDGGRLQHTGNPYDPPCRITTALTALRASYDMRGSQIPAMLEWMLKRNPRMAHYTSCTNLEDNLFVGTCEHTGLENPCAICVGDRLKIRPPRRHREPVVHFGAIGSGNQVVRDAPTRDRLARKHKLLCLEMEGAALKGHEIPFLVIRGICDYADKHKNKDWQPYAAAVAAACAKEFLSTLQPRQAHINLDPQQGHLQMHRNVSPEFHQSPCDEPLPPAKDTIHALMESLKFDQIDARQTNITSAHAKTCRWLLRKQEYEDWLDVAKFQEHHGLFWIKGKPGAGKSTIMKFVLDSFQKKKDRTVISFFFHARGHRMEKSLQGMYQSLLLQLLTRIPSLQRLLGSTSLASSSTWSLASLQALIRQAIENIGKNRLLCLIDALDECDPSEIRDMVYFFEDLRTFAASNAVQFHVCFASRHYPHITVRRGVELVLERQDGHEQDINSYVSDKLNIGDSDMAQTVNKELQEKAAGVFMWVVLVVKILNKSHDDGLNPTALRKELSKMPRDLHTLFRDILLRDGDKREELLLCMQWILFARQPLSPQELYLAIRAGTGSEEDISTKWNPRETTLDLIQRFILSASKGLVEVTRTRRPTVQFIHESVNDFLLKEKGLHDVWPDLKTDLKGLSHDKLKLCCMRYIEAQYPEFSHLARATEQDYNSREEKAVKAFPFLTYAAKNILYHAEHAEASGLSQVAFLSAFPKKQWIKLYNGFEKYAVRRYTMNASMLYILAENNSSHLIRAHPSKLSCIEVEKERYGPPLFAALATESFSAAREFVTALCSSRNDSDDHPMSDHDIEDRSPDSEIRRGFVFRHSISILRYLAKHGNAVIFFAVARHVSTNYLHADDSGRTFLHSAGHPEIATFLLNQNAAIHAVDEDGKTPLALAAERSLVPVVETLLQHGADINTLDHNGGTPLMSAVRSCCEPIVRLLLQRGAMIEAADGNGSTSLSRAVQRRDVAAVRTLHEHSADVEPEDPFTPGTLLHQAIASHNEAIAQLLLEYGAMVDTRDRAGDTPLMCAVKNNRGFLDDKMAELLLKHGASVHTQNPRGETPLHAAARNLSTSVVRLLLKRGADPNKTDSSGRLPIHHAAAVRFGHGQGQLSTVDILLRQGVGADAKDSQGCTPLMLYIQAVLWPPSTRIISRFLRCRSAANALDKDGRAPLHWAAESRFGDEVIRQLLENGAEIDQQDNNGRTALMCAVTAEEWDNVRSLLDNRSRIDIKDNTGNTALDLARRSGDKDIVQMLQNHHLMLQDSVSRGL